MNDMQPFLTRLEWLLVQNFAREATVNLTNLTVGQIAVVQAELIRICSRDILVEEATTRQRAEDLNNACKQASPNKLA